MTFYLMTEFRPDSNYGNVLGGPALPLLDPSKARPTSFATKLCGPYMDVNMGRLKVLPGRVRLSYLDPWGLPYFYNAKGGQYGDPVYRPDYEIFSVGPNEKTCQATLVVNRNAVDWPTIMADPRSGNDVDTAKGGNPLSANFGLKDQDDHNNWSQ